MMAPFSNLLEKENLMQRELTLTSQSGQLYYVTCYEYFIDLAQIDSEFQKGCFYNKYTSQDPTGNAFLISLFKIPSDRYFLSFNLCIISLKSQKH